MLGKLMKYEIPAVGRKLIPLYIAWVVTAAMLGIAIGTVESKSEFFMVLTGLMYASVATAIFVMAVFVIIQRYNGSLLGDEGYFSNVLPVTAAQHIFSKLLSAIIWVTLTVIAAFFTGVVIAICAGQLGEILKIFTEAEWEMIRKMLTGDFFLLVTEVIIICILSISKTIMQIYAALSIGHQARDKVVLASIGAYIGLLVAESLVGRIFMKPIQSLYSLTVESSSVNYSFLFLLLVIAVLIVIIGIYFFVCKYLLENKLNLN